MTIVEKGVFLTHSDMLGHRSCLSNSSVPQDQMNNGVCNGSAPCSCAPGSPMALDHVFKIWAINGAKRPRTTDIEIGPLTAIAVQPGAVALVDGSIG